jgi:hypothetical protein
MQPQIYNGFAESRFQGFGSVRRPIQCEGIERGHRRMAEVAVTGTVNPQFNWGGLGNIALSTLPKLFDLF